MKDIVQNRFEELIKGLQSKPFTSYHDILQEVAKIYIEEYEAKINEMNRFHSGILERNRTLWINTFTKYISDSQSKTMEAETKLTAAELKIKELEAKLEEIGHE